MFHNDVSFVMALIALTLGAFLLLYVRNHKNDLTKFCNEQVELNRYGFIRILNGKRTSYKGWKIKRVGVLK